MQFLPSSSPTRTGVRRPDELTLTTVRQQVGRDAKCVPATAVSVGVGAEPQILSESSRAEVGGERLHSEVDAVVEVIAATDVLFDPALPFDQLFGVGITPISVGRAPAVYGVGAPGQQVRIRSGSCARSSVSAAMSCAVRARSSRVAMMLRIELGGLAAGAAAHHVHTAGGGVFVFGFAGLPLVQVGMVGVASRGSTRRTARRGWCARRARRGWCRR